MAQKNKISIVVQAIDGVTSVVKRINSSIGRVAAPARAASRSLDGLFASSGVKRFGKAADDVGKRWDNTTRSVRAFATAGAIAVGALGGMFFALKRITDANEGALKSSAQFGTTVVDWQKLSYAADMADVSSQDLGAALGSLNKRAIAAATGNAESAQWFRRAGISIKDQSGHVKTSTQLLSELADRFKAMPNGPKKLALANGLLKDSQGALIPWLNGGSDAMREAGKQAEALGLTSEQLARDSATFNDEAKRTRYAMQGVGNAIASAILPELNKLLPQLGKWISANRGLVATKAKEFVGGFSKTLPQLVAGLGAVVKVVSVLATGVNTVVQAIGGWGTVISAVAGILAGKMVWSVVMLTKSIATLGAVTALTPFGLFMIAAAALAGIAFVVWDNWAPIKDLFVGMWDGIVAKFRWALDWIKKIVVTIDNAMPDWMKKFTLPGAAISAVANAIRVPTVQAAGSGGSASSPMPAIAGARSAASAKANIAIEVNDKRTRVTEMKSDTPGVKFDVDSGYTTAGAAW